MFVILTPLTKYIIESYFIFFQEEILTKIPKILYKLSTKFFFKIYICRNLVNADFLSKSDPFLGKELNDITQQFSLVLMGGGGG